MNESNGDHSQPGENAAPRNCRAHRPSPIPVAFNRNDETVVMKWRKSERERLIAERVSLDIPTRERYSQDICTRLASVIGNTAGLTVSAYWPFRGEPDLRSWLGDLQSNGSRCALPVVVQKGAPLIFRGWKPGDRLERGVWNIPIPAEGEETIPDIVIAPLVGFDGACYRLGYGGGFFDRTLSSFPMRPRIIGVGYAHAAIETIRPQPYDIPMDSIITEREVIGRHD